MTDVMQGIRILEVAEQTFVPAASAILAEWGADVIKIEHVERGDAMRGLMASGIMNMQSNVHVILEHSNRGKRSLGLDLTSDDGRDILSRLAATSDVFLTNKLPSVRTKLQVDVADLRAANPDIVYVCGTGQGERGAEADKGAYDHLAFWCRAGVAMGATPEGENPVNTPAPAFGDSIGAMTIAGGIMGALLHRERTGEATTVDVSLMGAGLWSMGAAIALSLQTGVPWRPPPMTHGSGNPLVGNYVTADGRWLAFSCLQLDKYWRNFVTLIGRPEMADDERYTDHATIVGNSETAHATIAGVLASEPLDHWRTTLAAFNGQWAIVQDTIEAARDDQTVANGYVQDYVNSEGAPFQLVSPPVQFGGVPGTPRRAPEFNEHGDEILQSIGLDWDTIIDLKVRGVVA